MIKIKTRTFQQTNKQTNKQINILDPKYLSQIKSNLHKIFRGTFCWCPTKIITEKTNKSINKQTHKQSNKHFITYISQTNQVWSSWKFWEISYAKIARFSKGHPPVIGAQSVPLCGRRPLTTGPEGPLRLPKVTSQGILRAPLSGQRPPALCRR